MEPGTQIQQLLFQQIKNKIPANVSLVDELADLLKISNDSAYRRLRGEKQLPLDEVAVLASHFQISVDALLDLSKDAVTFVYKNFETEPLASDGYFSRLKDQLASIGSCTEKEIIYVAKDLPIFYYFHFPELASFKIYFWKKHLSAFQGLENVKFEVGDADQELIRVGAEIIREFVQIPSVEVWTDETINSTFHQIQYSLDAGNFAKQEDATIIIKQLEQLLLLLQHQAENGCKMYPDGRLTTTPFELYQSDLMVNNNNILVKAGLNKSVYLTHSTLNYLITSNTSFCEETENWIKSMIKKSVLISKVGEKQRHLFFKKNFERLKNFSY